MSAPLGGVLTTRFHNSMIDPLELRRLIRRQSIRPGHAALAQSVEHFTRNEKVKSSILLGGSK
jgi:hypothetical protein